MRHSPIGSLAASRACGALPALPGAGDAGSSGEVLGDSTGDAVEPDGESCLTLVCGSGSAPSHQLALVTGSAISFQHPELTGLEPVELPSRESLTQEQLRAETHSSAPKRGCICQYAVNEVRGIFESQ